MFIMSSIFALVSGAVGVELRSHFGNRLSQWHGLLVEAAHSRAMPQDS